MRTALAALALVAVASSAGVARAAVIRVEISTTLSQVFSLQHTSLPMSVGDPVVLTFDYDDAVADTNPVDGSGQFPDAIVEATVAFPDQMLSFTFSGLSMLTTIDDDDTSFPILVDSFGFVSLGDDPLAGDTLEGDTPTAMTFGFAQSGISGVSIPDLVVDDQIDPPFDFDGLGVSQINLIGPIGTTGTNFVDVFGLNAGSAAVVPVPEPSLAGLALFGAWGLRRSARR
jgi:hypothetical protein